MRGTASILLALASSCLDPTEIDVQIRTNAQCSDVRGVAIHLGNATAAVAQTTACGGDGRVGNIVVTPSGSRTDKVTLRVTAGIGIPVEQCVPPNFGPQCIVARRTLGYIAHTKLVMPIDLSVDCIGVPCDATTTCVKGGCVPSDDPDCVAKGTCIPMKPPMLECGDTSGLQKGAVFAMAGGCPTHINRSARMGPNARPAFITVPFGGSGGNPSIGADGTIYSECTDGNLWVYKPDFSSSMKLPLGAQGPISQPAIGADGTIYAGSATGHLIAFNPSGTMKWSAATGGPITGSPAVGSNGTIYTGSYDGAVWATKPDGSKLWSVPLGAAGLVQDPAIGSDGLIYATNVNGALFALRPDGTTAWSIGLGEALSRPLPTPDGKIVFAKGSSFVQFDPKTMGSTWTILTSALPGAPARAADGTIYGRATDGTLYAISAAGQLKWSVPFPAMGSGNGAPMIGADGVVYMAGANTIMAVDPQGKELWVATLSGGFNGASPTITASGSLVVVGPSGMFRTP